MPGRAKLQTHLRNLRAVWGLDCFLSVTAAMPLIEPSCPAVGSAILAVCSFLSAAIAASLADFLLPQAL